MVVDVFVLTADNNGMTIQTCSEKVNLTEYGFIKEDCLFKTLAFKKTNKIYKNGIAEIIKTVIV